MTDSAPGWSLHSVLPGIAWPAVPSVEASSVLALLFQLEQSQWLPAGELRSLQLRQLESLTRHAHLASPHYRQSWRGAFDPDRSLDQQRFQALPILTRAEAQARHEEIKSTQSPASHGTPQMSQTSGSTGMPLRFLCNGMTQLVWNALTLRDHLWHRRDLSAKLAVIRRHTAPARAANWGIATQGLLNTGEAVAMTSGTQGTDIDAQLAWLQRERPKYLLTYPSNAAELARSSIASGILLPELSEVRTVGEPVTPEMRELCRAAWNASVVDAYSSEEVGYIALQCPSGTHYHMESESLYVEIVDEAGRPCQPGETGRVLVTSLHNFSFPLVRYELGDYAELGEPCACGRGLPVLRRIAGRVRNMLVAPDGKRYWPATGTSIIARIAEIRQYQFVQTEIDLIEARLVVSAPLSALQEQELTAQLLAGFPAGFRVTLKFVDAIPRGAGGKFEDFVSQVSAR